MATRVSLAVLSVALILLNASRAETEATGVAKHEPAGPKDAIWIEGESAARPSVIRNTWYDGVRKDALSGGKWVSHFGSAHPGTVVYTFRVIESDSFTFWVRANPLRARLSYRLDDAQAWRQIELQTDRRGYVNIASDNKPDLRYLAWIKVGNVRLKSGQHKIAFKFEDEEHDRDKKDHKGAIDCFTFVRIPFLPSGAKKPSVGNGVAGPADWFPVIFGDDPLSKDAVTDISHMIDAPAGRHGFLKRTGATLQFSRAKRPVKFWGVGADPRGKTPKQMVRTAKWFRKHGVNMVRQHTVQSAVGLLNAEGKFDAKRLDRYDRWFAALKEQGIYTTWSVIYPHHGRFLQKHDHPEVYAELRKFQLAEELERAKKAGKKIDPEQQKRKEREEPPIVVNDYINIDRRLQNVALRYFDTLLNHKNPYTGLAYKDDPALAVVEFQNESNVFFHTLNGLRSNKPPRFAREMRRRFFEFVNAKYKTKRAVADAWSSRWDRDDNWEKGELGLMGAYHLGGKGPLHEFSGQLRRAGDYVEFLTQLQRRYYARREEELRTIGFRGVTVTTGWKSGGPAASMANLYADTSADMIDRHNYFGGGDGGHTVFTGKVSNASHLGRPGTGLLNLALFQCEDRPFSVTEWSMLPPSPYKAEAAPLYAFYGMGLQGWDATYHFNCGHHRMGDGWPNLRKYVSHTPHYMGQFPALAFAIHNNHFQEGAVVAARRLTPEDVFAGKDVLGQSLSGGGFDDKELVGEHTTPPQAVAIGRVTIAFGDGKSAKMDLDPFWDRPTKTLKSSTEELVWNYGERCVEVRSPKTQGVIGFTSRSNYRLPGAKVTIKTPFVSLILTPLDNKKLEESRRILITAMAREKQTGAVFNDDWSRLERLGDSPLLMEPVRATIWLKGAKPAEIRPLDVYGVPKNMKVDVKPDGGFSIDGTYQTYYYFVRR